MTSSQARFLRIAAASNGKVLRKTLQGGWATGEDGLSFVITTAEGEGLLRMGLLEPVMVMKGTRLTHRVGMGFAFRLTDAGYSSIEKDGQKTIVS